MCEIAQVLAVINELEKTPQQHAELGSSSRKHQLISDRLGDD